MLCPIGQQTWKAQPQNHWLFGELFHGFGVNCNVLVVLCALLNDGSLISTMYICARMRKLYLLAIDGNCQQELSTSEHPGNPIK